jgi:hypothetical protein
MRKGIFRLLVIFAGTFWVSGTYAQEQFPMMDKIADRVIHKYQQSSCQQLMAERGQPKPQQMQRVVQLLHDDPTLRRAFIDRVAAPIANKLFECRMIP